MLARRFGISVSSAPVVVRKLLFFGGLEEAMTTHRLAVELLHPGGELQSHPQHVCVSSSGEILPRGEILEGRPLLRHTCELPPEFINAEVAPFDTLRTR